MREGSRGSGYSAKAGRMRDALMVSQLAFAVVLMIGAGLLLETLRDFVAAESGFNPSQVRDGEYSICRTRIIRSSIHITP